MNRATQGLALAMSGLSFAYVTVFHVIDAPRYWLSLLENLALIAP